MSRYIVNGLANGRNRSTSLTCWARAYAKYALSRTSSHGSILPILAISGKAYGLPISAVNPFTVPFRCQEGHHQVNQTLSLLYRFKIARRFGQARRQQKRFLAAQLAHGRER